MHDDYTEIDKITKYITMENKYSLPYDGGIIMDGTPEDILHRYEKIPTTIFSTESTGAEYVADEIVNAINAHETNRPFALGLTTGRTPLGVYQALVRRYQAREVSFKNVEVFSLDEFYPIKAKEQQSRNYRIHEDFISQVDILAETVHIIDGTVPTNKETKYCAHISHASNRQACSTAQRTLQRWLSQWGLTP